MADIPIELEVERVMNLVRGFGWEKTEQRIDTEYVYLIVRKKIKIEEFGIPT